MNDAITKWIFTENNMKYYQDRIVWKTPVTDNIVEHHDGAYSMLCSWGGLTFDLESEHDIKSSWLRFRSVLHTLSDRYPDLLIEQHLFRERDEEMINRYVDGHEKNMDRGRDLALPIIKDIAKLYSGYARTNKIYLVIAHKPKKSLFKMKSTSSNGAISYMMDFVKAFQSEFHEFNPEDLNTYAGVVSQCATRNRYINKDDYITDYRFPLNEQWIQNKPNLTDDGYLETDGVLTSVGVLYMHPDADIDQFRRMASINADLHFVQIIQPVNTEKEIEDIDHQNVLKTASMKEGKNLRKINSSVGSASNFANYVSANNERIYNHCWLVHIHGTVGTSLEAQRYEISGVQNLLKTRIRKLAGGVGEFRFDRNLQMLYWRVGLIGNGYCAAYWRKDHTSNIAHLAPIVKFNRGIVGAPSLRISDNAQPVGVDRFASSVAHSFTIAMTRGGKGTEKCVEIIETYGRGVDWFCIEYGGTYEFLVHGLKGNYVRADIGTSINPFPSQSEINACDDLQKREIRSITIDGLAFLLTKRTALETSEIAVAGMAYDELYSNLEKEAPVTSDYLMALSSLTSKLTTDTQKAACKAMMNELKDFLSTPAGEALNNPTNIDFSKGIVCIDFKNVAIASKIQAVYLLNYVAMRYIQVAVMRRKHVCILMDEVHKFMDLDIKATGAALKLVARTGGKDRVWADIVTQGMTELLQLDSEVIGSIPNQNLLYRDDQHELIGERINMPDHVIQHWSEFENPLNKPYRPHLKRIDDDWYSFRNIFPRDLLDIASTSGNELPIKSDIVDEMPGHSIWVMLEEFRKRMEIQRQLGESK